MNHFRLSIPFSPKQIKHNQFLLNVTSVQKRRHIREKCDMKAKRCLFGPSDGNHVHKQYTQMMQEQLKHAESEWNFNFNEENPSLSVTARYKWEVVRSKSVPPVYRTYRIFDPKKRVKNEPEKTIIKSAKNRKQLNFKVMAKKQRTLTDLLPVKRSRPVHPSKKAEQGNTSPDRIFGVLTRSTSRVHTRSTARRHLVV